MPNAFWLAQPFTASIFSSSLKESREIERERVNEPPTEWIDNDMLMFLFWVMGDGFVCISHLSLSLSLTSPFLLFSLSPVLFPLLV